MPKPEPHLFIIWNEALDKKDEIIADIQEKFFILETVEVNWNEENYEQNLSRFYGIKLENATDKQAHCGTGPFTVVTVLDEHPVYEMRETSRGEENVNTKLFDAKERYRSMTGGGHKIHATNSLEEMRHDLRLLLHVSLKQYMSQFKDATMFGKPKISTFSHDVIGSSGWKDMEQVFATFNDTIPYVVLRNFEELPEKYYMDEHDDIDMLVENPYEASLVLNARSVFPEQYRVHYEAKIGGRPVRFDLRYVGDSYYEGVWERQILKTRTMERGFYRPESEHYFYSLLYHALVHKPALSEDYRARLQDMGHAMNPSITLETDNDFTKSLGAYLRAQDYGLPRPDDQSVFFNAHYVDINKSMSTRLLLKVRRLLGRLKRRAQAFANR